MTELPRLLRGIGIELIEMSNSIATDGLDVETGLTSDGERK